MERQRNERLCCLEGAWSIPEFYSVADPGEGPGGGGGGGRPFFLDQTEARRAENIFLGDRSPPPLI